MLAMGNRNSSILRDSLELSFRSLSIARLDDIFSYPLEDMAEEKDFGWYSLC